MYSIPLVLPAPQTEAKLPIVVIPIGKVQSALTWENPAKTNSANTRYLLKMLEVIVFISLIFCLLNKVYFKIISRFIDCNRLLLYLSNRLKVNLNMILRERKWQYMYCLVLIWVLINWLIALTK